MTPTARVSPSERPASGTDHHLPDGGDADAGARFHHRQRGVALHAGLARRELGRDHLGPYLLHHGGRDHDRTSRLAGGAVRAQESVHSLPGRLHRRVDAVRGGGIAAPDGAVPAAARRIRRRLGAAVAGGAARHLSARAARLGDGDLGRRRDDRADPRPHARRLPDRDLQLALRVLRQPAVRNTRLARPSVSDAARAPAIGAAVRLAGIRRPGPRARRAAAHARSRRGQGLVLILGDRARRRARGPRDISVRGASVHRAGPVHSSAHLP